MEDTERDISNLNLRKAISYAIDRQQFIDTVFKNDNVPSPSFAFGINGVNTETFSEVVIEANGGEPLYPPTANEELARNTWPRRLRSWVTPTLPRWISRSWFPRERRTSSSIR